MTYKECIDNFPVENTIAGIYGTEQSFTLEPGANVDDIETWSDPPLEWGDDDAFQFVIYDPSAAATFIDCLPCSMR